MTKRDTITINDVLDVYDYDREAGKFTRKYAQGISRKGDVAGTKLANGYLSTGVKGHRCFVHRLVWFVETGTWPTNDIDHINGNRTDNRFENLRTSSRSENNANSKRPKNNTSGFKGASFDKRKGRWAAEIWIFKRKKFLGYFDSPSEAGSAYLAAAKTHYGQFAKMDCNQ